MTHIEKTYETGAAKREILTHPLRTLASGHAKCQGHDYAH